MYEDNVKKIKYDTKTEYFECDCHDRDDMIIAKRSLYLYDDPTWNKDMDIFLEFVTSDGDWQDVYDNNMLVSFFKKLWWRIKKAISILATGKIIRTGCWMPARVENENGLVGVYSTRKLGEFLIESADKIAEFYKEAQKIKHDPNIKNYFDDGPAIGKSN